MGKKCLWAACVFLSAVLASGCSKKPDGAGSGFIPNKAPESAEAAELYEGGQQLPGYEKAPEVIGDKSPVSRALAAKMLALSLYSANTIDTLERIIPFKDTRPELWYDRYINACYTEGIMKGAGDEFKPEEPLSLGQAQILLDKISNGKSSKLDINDGNRDKAISYALWTELFMQAEEAAGPGVSGLGFLQKEITVLATSDNNIKLREGNAITDLGHITHAGISLAGYIDKCVSVLLKDGEIVAPLAVVSVTPTIKNAYLVSHSPLTVTIFSGGAERTYSSVGLNIKNGIICDITISGTKALSVHTYSDISVGVVKRISTSSVELDGKDRLELLPDACVYSTVDGDIKLKSIKSVAVGTDIAMFVLKGGKACGAVITRPASPKSLRVLIATTGFNGYVHENVEITSEKEFTVFIGDSVKKYKPGEVFSLEKSDPLVLSSFTRAYIVPSEETKLQILSVKRNWSDNESPKYRGTLEIGAEQGGYSIVNEVGIEEYLYAVVPSEMPTSYGPEATKVQAVTARSFAYNQFFENRFSEYGANVDDSVLSQVYNNIPENETSIRAVKETEGMCIMYYGSVVSANFFSTSSGVTANSGEVWAAGAAFPAETPEYLSSSSQLVSGRLPDLRKEENAERFFKSDNIESYDSGFAWFRWNTVMTAAELSASVNANLKTRREASPAMIKTLQSDGSYKSDDIKNIGDVTDIEVIQRGEGGNIMTLKITGTLATITVSSEYNIRMLIKPVQYINGNKPIVTKRSDGSVLEDYSLMPSAFFVFDKQRGEGGKLEALTFFGGGNGHGVGMSQNGVKGMIDAGKSFDEIIAHYYKGTKVVKIIN